MSTATSIVRGDLSEAILRCRSAQEAWGRLPVRDRLRPVRALRHLLVDQVDQLCAALSQDIGKPANETLAGEVLPLAAACRFLEREATRLLRPRNVPWRHRPLWLTGQRDLVHRRPHGLVGIIGTWNYPIMLNGIQLVQALTAGNAVLWKPSELAAQSAVALFDLLGQAGYPSELAQLMEATRAAGPQLAQADVDHVVFTGSATVGRALARTLGERLVSSSLELSGCDPMFVLEDADLNLAARAAWFGATLNCGQTCVAVRRVLVHCDQYTSFLDSLRPLAASAQPARPVIEKEVANARRLLDDALADGARPLLETTAACPADRFTPTVVIDARPEMAIWREASFAPIMAVMPYATLEQAFQANAQCPYGLGASIFTRDLTRGQQLAARLRAGTVTINEAIVPTAHPATPFGGRGQSGWGVTQGAEGLLEMTVPQVVSVCSGSFRPHYELGTGKEETQEALARGLLEWGHGATWRQRWRGLKQLLKGWWKA
jgi:acyl-CoA reductase-like NAD-dependent aldehyde dehydrogenase